MTTILSKENIFLELKIDQFFKLKMWTNNWYPIEKYIKYISTSVWSMRERHEEFSYDSHRGITSYAKSQ